MGVKVGDTITDLIIKGVCRNIYKEFELPVYTEKVIQGLEEPCFFVTLKSSVCRHFFGKRYRMENKIQVKYYAPYQVENSSCGAVVERLCQALEVIECDGYVRGSNFGCSISDGILTFNAEYNMFVYLNDAEDDGTLMQELELNQEV